MDALRGGTYNKTVANEPLYFHRIGVVSLGDVWACEPESRTALFDGMDSDTFEAFCSYAALDAEDASKINRLPSMTGQRWNSGIASESSAPPIFKKRRSPRVTTMPLRAKRGTDRLRQRTSMLPSSVRGCPRFFAMLVRFLRVSRRGDLIGLVPHDIIPVYYESMFPKRLETILDFMHVYDEDMASFGDKIE